MWCLWYGYFISFFYFKVKNKNYINLFLFQSHNKKKFEWQHVINNASNSPYKNHKGNRFNCDTDRNNKLSKSGKDLSPNVHYVLKIRNKRTLTQPFY